MVRACILAIVLSFLWNAGHGHADATFQQAAPGRVLSFPGDHGKHQNFQTEWWYFTGNLSSDDGATWGFQLTFFRRSVSREPARKKSAWGVRDLYLAHFAISSLTDREFFHTDVITREGPGLAEASAGGLNVRIKGWRAEKMGERMVIRADYNGHALDLILIPQKPPVLHGDGGYSRKGERQGQASYYYSFTRLRAQGRLTFRGKSYRVSGLAWMDHEFGSSILEADQAGWDWFSIQLDEGTDLMLFRLRKKDGSFEPVFGTLVKPGGTQMDLHGRPITIRSTGTWRSFRTKAVYPSGWTVELPGERTRLTLTPAFQDQELTTGKSSRVTYWEGAVFVSGTRGGTQVNGRGYVELTGYAHAMAGRL